MAAPAAPAARGDAEIQAGAEAVSRKSGPYALSNWVVSDLTTTMLEHHSGAALRKLGASIMVLNSFELYNVSELQGTPSLIIQACVWPPTDCLGTLERLIQSYCKHKPSHQDKCRYYETLVFEAICGQMPLSTVCSICRQSDYIKAGVTPAVLSALSHVPGYTPKQSAVDDNGDLVPLHSGHSLIARTTLNGPLNPQEFISSRGHIDLVGMCSAATANNMNIIFLGEFDGSLALGCATGMLYHQKVARPISATWSPPEGKRLKVLGGYVGNYEDYHDYAKDHRVRQILADYLKNDGDGSLWTAPTTALLQPQTNINAAVMWFHARVCAHGGYGGNYIPDK